MKKNLLVIFSLVIAVSVAGQVKLENQIDSVSYCLGADIGANLKKSGAEKINTDLFVQAMKDAFAESELLIDEQKRMEVIRDYFQSLQEEQRKLQSEKFEKNLEEGIAFLEKNKKNEGVKVTESGLQYVVLKEGSGETPTAESRVKTHYKGMLIDGTVFDSSYGRGEPLEFSVQGVIKGWTEALLMMKTGAKWKIFIPSELAYGDRGAGGTIPPHSVLVFEIELLEIVAD